MLTIDLWINNWDVILQITRKTPYKQWKRSEKQTTFWFYRSHSYPSGVATASIVSILLTRDSENALACSLSRTIQTTVDSNVNLQQDSWLAINRGHQRDTDAEYGLSWGQSTLSVSMDDIVWPDSRKKRIRCHHLPKIIMVIFASGRHQLQIWLT